MVQSSRLNHFFLDKRPFTPKSITTTPNAPLWQNLCVANGRLPPSLSCKIPKNTPPLHRGSHHESAAPLHARAETFAQPPFTPFYQSATIPASVDKRLQVEMTCSPKFTVMVVDLLRNATPHRAMCAVYSTHLNYTPQEDEFTAKNGVCTSTISFT